jgi:hypothetical protein
VAFQYVIVKNSGRGRGYLPTIMPEASNIAGYDLGNLWAFSDLGNIIIVYVNVPMLYLGARYVLRATQHYKATGGADFTSDVIGISCPYWDKKISAVNDIQDRRHAGAVSPVDAE